MHSLDQKIPPVFKYKNEFIRLVTRIEYTIENMYLALSLLFAQSKQTQNLAVLQVF